MKEENNSLDEKNVSRYDGQTIYVDHAACYELGNYLGGGAAGV
jgi:hypothetical protein